MSKLTSAQAYALQVKADRRAAAAERRQGAVKADNARVAEMYPAAPKAAPKAPKSGKRVRWSGAELDLMVELYPQYVDAANGSDNREGIVKAFSARYPQRSEGSAHLLICQIKQLDAYYPAEGMSNVNPQLAAKLYAADPVRFPGGATREEKVLGALDLLLTEVRG